MTMENYLHQQMMEQLGVITVGGIYTGNFRVYGGTAVGSGNVVLDSPIDNTVLSTIGTNFTANYSVDTDFNMTNATYYIWNSTGIFNNTVMEIVTGITNSTNKYIDEFSFLEIMIGMFMVVGQIQHLVIVVLQLLIILSLLELQ